MRYVPCWKQLGLLRDRYFELLHFCRQYQDWKLEADSLLGIRATKMDGQPHGTSVSDPVAQVAEKRERLKEKIDLVEQCARSVGDGKWYAAIIQNVCMGRSYTMIDKTIMPTTDSNAFFKYRREFFGLLDKIIK